MIESLPFSLCYLMCFGRKHGLNCHRMKPALFSILCDIKEKTGGWFIIRLLQWLFLSPLNLSHVSVSVNLSGKVCAWKCVAVCTRLSVHLQNGGPCNPTLCSTAFIQSVCPYCGGMCLLWPLTAKIRFDEISSKHYWAFVFINMGWMHRHSYSEDLILRATAVKCTGW